MRARLRLLRNVVFAAGIVTALGFGAQRLVANTSCRECTQPPDIECKHVGNPDAYCNYLCIEEYECEYGGGCNVPMDRCECFEK